MNVTPTDSMFKAMSALVDATVGEEPGKLETTPAAERRRSHRKNAFDILHSLVRLSMREGVRRYCQDRGMAVVEDSIKPTGMQPEGAYSDVLHS